MGVMRHFGLCLGRRYLRFTAVRGSRRVRLLARGWNGGALKVGSMIGRIRREKLVRITDVASMDVHSLVNVYDLTLDIVCNEFNDKLFVRLVDSKAI